MLTFVLWQALLKRYKTGNDLIDIADLLEKPEKEGRMVIEIDEEHNMSLPDGGRLRKRIVIVTLGVTLLLWLTGRIHGIPPAAVSGIPIIVFTMVSIITGEDVRTLPWDTLMLVAGGLSLGLAIQDIGLSDYFVSQLQHLSVATWLVVPTVFALMTVVMSNVMSNTAAATILMPIGAIWPGLHPAVLPLAIGLAASCALFLPVSTPPNAIVYATGRVTQQDFRFGGIIVGLLALYVSSGGYGWCGCCLGFNGRKPTKPFRVREGNGGGLKGRQCR
ncbi:MAG: SLC13 family permease [Saprospiraceae bacterium]